MFDSVEAPLKSIPESEWVVGGGKSRKRKSRYVWEKIENGLEKLTGCGNPQTTATHFIKFRKSLASLFAPLSFIIPPSPCRIMNWRLC